MAVEHQNDIVVIYNPMNRPFTVKYGGVPRTIEPHKKAQYNRFLAKHITKHMSDLILQVKEYQYKKKHGKEISLMRNKLERQKVMRMIVLGVASYHLPQDESGVQRPGEVRDPNDKELEKALDLGDISDAAVGEPIDEIEFTPPPEAVTLSHESTKAQIREQLNLLGVKYDAKENKTELLARMGVHPSAEGTTLTPATDPNAGVTAPPPLSPANL